MKGIDDLQTDIDQSLEYIESQQSELAQALETYEEKVMELMEGSNADGSGRVVMNPVDEERERSYHLAESLNKQLDDMGKQLKYMIDDINHSKASGASGFVDATKSVSGGAAASSSSSALTSNAADEDNPVETIVQILSQHLSSLQWLDSSTADLTLQIHELERRATAAKEDAERVHKHHHQGNSNTGSGGGGMNRSTFGASIQQQQQRTGMFGASVSSSSFR
jgi:nuclear pore complex protein Nup62